MFSAAIKSVNTPTTNADVKVVININKRSKVCDADSAGNVNVNCRR